MSHREGHHNPTYDICQKENQNKRSHVIETDRYCDSYTVPLLVSNNDCIDATGTMRNNRRSTWSIKLNSW